MELRGKRIAAGSARDRCERPEKSGLNGRPAASGCGLHFHADMGDALAGIPPVVHRARRHLDGPAAGTRNALVAGHLEADLAVDHLEPLDEVIVDVRSYDGRAGLQPQVDLEAPPVGYGRADVQTRDLPRCRIVKPRAGTGLRVGVARVH